MADNDMRFLVQWEDSYLSVIEKRNIIEPLKENYKEGELILANFGTKSYEAVIQEIHANIKYLQKQAKQTPRYPYAIVKQWQNRPPTILPSSSLPSKSASNNRFDQSSSNSRSDKSSSDSTSGNSQSTSNGQSSKLISNSQSNKSHSNSQSDKSPSNSLSNKSPSNRQSNQSDKSPSNSLSNKSPSNRQSNQFDKSPSNSPSDKSPSNRQSNQFDKSPSNSPSDKSPSYSPLENLTSNRQSNQSDKSTSNSHSGKSSSDSISGKSGNNLSQFSRSTSNNQSTKSSSGSSEKRKDLSFEEEVRSLRKKMKKLEERVFALEGDRSAKSEDDVANELVAHLSESDITDTVEILARHIFTEDEIINSSRTGKKTVKSGDCPRPPLNQAKFERLQRLVILKTKVSKEVFLKKFENFQKVLRRK